MSKIVSKSLLAWSDGFEYEVVVLPLEFNDWSIKWIIIFIWIHNKNILQYYIFILILFLKQIQKFYGIGSLNIIIHKSKSEVNRWHNSKDNSFEIQI